MATPDSEEISDKEKVRGSILCCTGNELSSFYIAELHICRYNQGHLSFEYSGVAQRSNCDDVWPLITFECRFASHQTSSGTRPRASSTRFSTMSGSSSRTTLYSKKEPPGQKKKALFDIGLKCLTWSLCNLQSVRAVQQGSVDARPRRGQRLPVPHHRLQRPRRRTFRRSPVQEVLQIRPPPERSIRLSSKRCLAISAICQLKSKSIVR